jgi:hypothetical protein
MLAVEYAITQSGYWGVISVTNPCGFCGYHSYSQYKPKGIRMALVDRVKNILLTPKTEWPVIEGEKTTTADLMTGYVAPLAAIPVVCGFIGTSLIGFSAFGVSIKTPIVAGISIAIFSYVMSFVSVIIAGHIINALAPTFGAQKDLAQATKVATYAFTAGWIGGIFSILPAMSILGILATLYGIYLLYLGLPVLMKNPEDKSIGYTAVTVIAILVVSIIVGVIAAAIGGATGAARGMLGGIGQSSSRSASVSVDPKSDLGKLEAWGKKMEEAGKKMEAAQKSGNQDEAAKATTAMLGTMLGGGKNVEPVDIEKLKPFVPETFAGLAKKSSKAEKAGALGIMVSKAEARYGDDSSKSVNLEVSDVGGAGGMLAFAGWAMVQGEKQDEYGSEKTGKVDGRLVHEKMRKDGRNEYNIVLGERFIVTAKGNGIDLNTLKSAVVSLDLGKLEAMKNEGVQK